MGTTPIEYFGSLWYHRTEVLNKGGTRVSGAHEGWSSDLVSKIMISLLLNSPDTASQHRIEKQPFLTKHSQHRIEKQPFLTKHKVWVSSWMTLNPRPSTPDTEY